MKKKRKVSSNRVPKSYKEYRTIECPICKAQSTGKNFREVLMCSKCGYRK